MKRYSKKIFIYIVIISFFGISSFSAQAETVDELEVQIEQRAQEREDLEKEAERIRLELTKVGAKKGVLTVELNSINAERKSIDNTIKQTENEIDSLGLKINKSAQRISLYRSEIETHANTISLLLRRVSQHNNLSFLEIISSAEKFSDFFSIRDSYLIIQKPLIKTTDLLRERKVELWRTNQILSIEQNELAEEKTVLGDQRLIVKNKENEKATVLKKTKQKESYVQKNLSTTLATIDKLDAEIRDFESKLEFALNPNSIPQKGSAVLDWPLKKKLMPSNNPILITQRFGKTVSSERLYVSGSHSGNDFRAAIGTPVYAVADGIVKGVGDTDKQCYKASFGKWVFIEHDIGLSSTIGHLSSWKVSEGQRVKKGDLVAYSGNTGYSTAPHLHLTIYATKGVDGGQGARVTNRPSSACPGTDYRMPLAPTAAYLDPLAYLPKTDSSYFKHN